MSEEWTTVTANDKKRVMRKRGQRKEFCTTIGNSLVSVIEDSATFRRVLEVCKKYLRQTHFFGELSTLLKNSGIEFLQLVCYGIGNFSASSIEHFSASMWQMTCAFCIEELLVATYGRQVTFYYYDPCACPLEKELLVELGVTVLTANDKGKLAFEDLSTLFFMPHCPKRLYENVTWSNWHDLHHTAIVGNSLINHVNTLSSKKSCVCLTKLVPWIDERKLESSKPDIKESPGNFRFAFNDTFLTIFRINMSERTDTSRPARPDLLIEDEDDDELV
jgi:hypothetical protein